MRTVRLSELFTKPNRSLVIYPFMFGKKQTKACLCAPPGWTVLMASPIISLRILAYRKYKDPFHLPKTLPERLSRLLHVLDTVFVQLDCFRSVPASRRVRLPEALSTATMVRNNFWVQQRRLGSSLSELRLGTNLNSVEARGWLRLPALTLLRGAPAKTHRSQSHQMRARVSPVRWLRQRHRTSR